jgi:hypothetical protein
MNLLAVLLAEFQNGMERQISPMLVQRRYGSCGLGKIHGANGLLIIAGIKLVHFFLPLLAISSPL